MSEFPASGRTSVKVAAWFFAALAMVALLSPPGASHDEAFHARSIWCGQGERSPYCQERFNDQEGALVARTNIETQNCQAKPRDPLLCPTNRLGESVFRTNNGLYPPLFYYVMSWFVVPNMSVSVVLMRLVSALLISLMLGLLLWLLSPRYRVVLLLLSLTTFSSTGYFLFSSINPSSWTSFGVGTSWLALHAALTERTASRGRRAALTSVALVALTMAVGSRADGAGFIVLMAILTVLHVGSTQLQAHRKRLAVAVVATSLCGWVLLERFSSMSPLENMKRLYTYSDGQRDNVAFFSENILQVLPNTLRVLGTVPSMSSIIVPDAVFVFGIGLLGFSVIRTYNGMDRVQLVGAVVIVIAMVLVVMAQVALVDGRDGGGIEPRYTFPLLLALVGWWYVLAPEDLFERVESLLRPAAIVATAAFALTMFTVAERYVDRQSYGLRFLPEGPDQWWWPWLPFGPNFVVVLAPVFVWCFFRDFRTVIATMKQLPARS